MSKEQLSLEKIKEYPKKNAKLLKRIKNEILKDLDQKREVMFSDIINFIIRKDYEGEIYTRLIIWCNYKMRIGEIYLKF